MSQARCSSIRRTTIGWLAAAGAATFLVASANPAGAAVVTSTIAVPATGVVSTTATCPRGQRAISAGWDSTTRTQQVQVQTQESRKLGQRGWILTVSRLDQINPAPATTTLILNCFKWAPKTKEVVTLTSSPDDYTAFDTADAVCPGRRTVQAGGFSIPIAPDFSVYAELIESYRVADDTWRARMEGNTGTQLATYAYCAKGNPPTEAVSTTVQATSTSGSYFTAVSPPCGKKRKAVAGGISQPDASSVPGGWVFAVFQFLRVGKSWQTSASHFGPPTTLNTHVYCAKKP